MVYPSIPSRFKLFELLPPPHSQVENNKVYILIPKFPTFGFFQYVLFGFLRPALVQNLFKIVNVESKKILIICFFLNDK